MQNFQFNVFDFTVFRKPAVSIRNKRIYEAKENKSVVLVLRSNSQIGTCSNCDFRT